MSLSESLRFDIAYMIKNAEPVVTIDFETLTYNLLGIERELKRAKPQIIRGFSLKPPSTHTKSHDALFSRHLKDVDAKRKSGFGRRNVLLVNHNSASQRGLEYNTTDDITRDRW